MKRVAIVATYPHPVRRFLSAHIRALCENDYEVWLILKVDPSEDMSFLPRDVRVLPVGIERKPSPIRDLKVLIELTQLFRRERFDIVHSKTPKAGLLGMTAAWLARVPIRIHTFGGEVWATSRGLGRAALKTADKVTAACATEVLVVAPSERRFLLREGVVTEAKSRVLANGSACGVDTDLFRPDRVARMEIRKSLGIGEDDVLFLFVGRLNTDKGVPLLVEAFRRLPGSGRGCFLVFIGPDEEGLADDPALVEVPGVRFLGELFEPERYMAAADVLCLPSFREGFAQVVIEAASVELPTIASDIYGIADTMIDGVTGLLHPAGDVDAMAGHMQQMLTDVEKRRQFGAAGRQRVLAEFRQEEVTEALLSTYEELVKR